MALNIANAACRSSGFELLSKEVKLTNSILVLPFNWFSPPTKSANLNNLSFKVEFPFLVDNKIVDELIIKNKEENQNWKVMYM